MSRKRKRAIGRMVLAAVLLAGTAGLLWFSGLSSEKPPEETVQETMQEQEDPKSAESAAEDSGEPSVAGEGSTVPQEEKAAAEAAEAASSEDPPEAEPEETAVEPVPREPTEAERTAAVLAGYEPAFEALRQEAASEVDALIEEAKAAYYAVDEADRTVAFKLELANTYLKRGNALEEAFDGRFYALLEKLKTALAAEGLGEAAADGVEAAYVAEKKSRRKALLDKAMEKI